MCFTVQLSKYFFTKSEAFLFLFLLLSCDSLFILSQVVGFVNNFFHFIFLFLLEAFAAFTIMLMKFPPETHLLSQRDKNAL